MTGDIGTGKTTLCRALLEEIDRNTFSALVLHPFLSEEDLLKHILQDFGVVSREDVKRGRLAGVSKQELIETIYDFLLGLLPLRASAVLIIDEAQHLPMAVLEQIRILSNLETDKEKLLQIVLVGQLNLHPLLKAPQMRQLDQRVSIRYQLRPLSRDEVAAYVSHRLMVARRLSVCELPAQGARHGAPSYWRHSAPREPGLRSIPAGGLLGRYDPCVGGHGAPGGREPRTGGKPSVTLLLVSAAGVGGGDRGRRNGDAGAAGLSIVPGIGDGGSGRGARCDACCSSGGG